MPLDLIIPGYFHSSIYSTQDGASIKKPQGILVAKWFLSKGIVETHIRCHLGM